VSQFEIRAFAIHSTLYNASHSDVEALSSILMEALGAVHPSSGSNPAGHGL
jgi:hypothetical protein